MSRRLGVLTSAIALASVAVSGRRHSAFEPATCIMRVEKAPIEFVRYFCRECVRADAREAWGAWQMRLL